MAVREVMVNRKRRIIVMAKACVMVDGSILSVVKVSVVEFSVVEFSVFVFSVVVISTSVQKGPVKSGAHVTSVVMFISASPNIPNEVLLTNSCDVILMTNLSISCSSLLSLSISSK